MEDLDGVCVGGEDSSEGGKCPICFSRVSRVGGEGASFELEQCVQVYFVFRHVLQMPPGEVEKLMGILWEDNLECWRGLGLSCEDKVEQCRTAYREMVLSTRRFEEVRRRTVLEGRKLLNQDGGGEKFGESEWRQTVDDIVEECNSRNRKRKEGHDELPVPEVSTGSLKSPVTAKAEPLENNYFEDDPCGDEDVVKEEILEAYDLRESEIKGEGDADSLFVPDAVIQEPGITDKQSEEENVISSTNPENIGESGSKEEESNSHDDKEDYSASGGEQEESWEEDSGKKDSDSIEDEKDSGDEEYAEKDSIKFFCDLSTCLDRGRKLDLKAFLRHYFHHDELIFQCSECPHLSSSILANTCHWSSSHKELLSSVTEDSRYFMVPPVYPTVPWWCPECIYSFSSEKARNHHLQTDHPDKPQPSDFPQSCNQCSGKYASILELKLHRGTVHQMIQECSKCSKQFQSKSKLMVHYKTDHPRCSDSLESLQCDDCSKMFTSEDDLVNHYKSEHLPRSSSTRCTDCSGIFKSELLLLAHRRRIHQKDLLKCAHCPMEFVFKVELVKHLMSTHSNLNQTRPRMCPHCAKVFTEEKKLSEHILLEHPSTTRTYLGMEGTVQCDLCLKSVSTAGLQAHWLQVHGVTEGNRLLCPEADCSAIFFTRKDLRDHILRRHSNASPQFSCAECGKSFFTKTKLSVHVKDVHAERPFKCSRCGKGFARKDRLEKHHCGSRKGPKSRPHYTCGECDQVFTQERLLERHKRKIHPKPKQKKRKPYVPKIVVCHICGKSLKIIHLSTHIKESHHIGNPDVFCDQCGKKLQNRRYLKVHLALVHNIGPPEMIRFPCTIEGCGKKLKTKEELDLHLKHHKAPEHNCKLCGKAFFSEQKLKKHVDAEHDQKKRALSGGPHKCDQCGKGFALPRYLTRHLKRHIIK